MNGGFQIQDSLVEETKLGQAIKHYDITKLRTLILAGINPNVKDYKGNNPLHLLTTSDWQKAVRDLVWG